MTAQRSSGFSFLEVLIAVVVGAVGILAIVNLNLNNVRLARSAYLQSLAANYARDMGERIQANKAAVSSNGVSGYSLPTPANTAACRTTVGCSPASLAAHDVWEWQNALSGNASAIQPEAGISPVGLPAGAGEVCVDSSGGVTSITGTLTTAAGTAQCDEDGVTNGVTHLIRVHWTDQGEARVLDYVVRINSSNEQGY